MSDVTLASDKPAESWRRGTTLKLSGICIRQQYHNNISTEVKCFSETIIFGLHNDCEDEDDINTASDDILELTRRVILFIHEPISIWMLNKKWRAARNKIVTDDPASFQ